MINFDGVKKIRFVSKLRGSKIEQNDYYPNAVSLRDILIYIVAHEKDLEFYYIDINNTFLTNDVIKAQVYLEMLDSKNEI